MPRFDVRTCKTAGFTVLELLIVVAIIGILAAVAIPKYADLLRKSNEGATQGNLGQLKSAISIYFGDMSGLYPAELDSLTTNAKYLSAVPKTKTPNYHPDIATVAVGSDSAAVTDSGGWMYANEAGNRDAFGEIRVNCTHTDSKGGTWASY